MNKPVAWACRTCGKVDWADEQLARPEHISHRGVDIGSCDGEMVKLYGPEVVDFECEYDELGAPTRIWVDGAVTNWEGVLDWTNRSCRSAEGWREYRLVEVRDE